MISYGCDTEFYLREPIATVSDAQPERTRTTMRIRMKVEGTVINALLEDTEAARDFASLLPLDLTLEDYAATEKITYLPRKLSTEGAPSGTDPAVGDIAYYAPWGNLALFYRDFGYSDGLVKLGRIESGVEVLQQAGRLKVTVERIEQT